MAVPYFLQNPYLRNQGFYDENGNPRPGLTLGDLYQAPDQEAGPPDLPQHVDGIGGLSEEDRRRLRQRAILQAALAFAAPHGQVGTALAAAAQGQGDAEQAAIDAQNKEADQRFLFQREQYGLNRQAAQDKAAQD